MNVERKCVGCNVAYVTGAPGWATVSLKLVADAGLDVDIATGAVCGPVCLVRAVKQLGDAAERATPVAGRLFFGGTSS